MKTRHTATLTVRLALVAAAAALTTGAAFARDVAPDAIAQVHVGESKPELQAQFGEPQKSESYLFAPGSAWYYYVEGGQLGNEHLLRIAFDSQGRATETRIVDAGFYNQNRHE
jgi:outer membrane protein assembly factor BamE (lipoprotein component of BamABCDE complex)